MRKTTWPGNWKVACDVCGFWFPREDIQTRWDGLVVCSKDFETRHPQTLIKIRGEHAVPDIIRKDGTDTFQGTCDVATSSGYADLAVANCARADEVSVPYLILKDMFTNGHGGH
jgi:hypothetical protein